MNRRDRRRRVLWRREGVRVLKKNEEEDGIAACRLVFFATVASVDLREWGAECGMETSTNHQMWNSEYSFN